MKATVADIAKTCGLSTATVDRVLNNRAGASAANRQRVLEAAKQLGYLPVAGSITLPSRPGGAYVCPLACARGREHEVVTPGAGRGSQPPGWRRWRGRYARSPS